MKINLKKIITNQKLLVNGYCLANEWITEAKNKFEVINPATGEILATLPFLSRLATAKAIDHSFTAFDHWKNNLASERAIFLLKWANLIKKNQNDLATIMTLEQGKPLNEAKAEVLYATSFLEWFAEEGKRAYGEIIPPHKTDVRIVIEKQPIGVVGIITPWNFPLAMLTRKIAPALAAGCTCVIKPAEKTPLSAIAILTLAIEAGMPPGVINLVFGDYDQIGKELTTNSLVKKISFTGSTEVGKLLLRQSATTLKKVSLELGGNAPFIVFKDADLKVAVEQAIICKYRNTGQTCVCANRFFIEQEVYEEFIHLFKKEVEKLKVGNGLVAGIEQGPLIDENALKKVKKHLADALEQGAKIICGGHEIQNDLAGFFFEPTILSGVNERCLIHREETFGPLAPLISFKSEKEVITLANNTPYGLAGYFFTQNLSRAWRVAEALEVGMVGINQGIISTAAVPFGGVKESGLGREGSHWGIDDYFNIKYILMGI